MTARSFPQFLMEEGITDENGNVVLATSTPTKRRRTNAQINIDRQNSLLAVFNAMSENNLSFRDFLIAAFNSTHETITQRAIKTVAKRVRANLNNTAKDTSFKHPADSISRKAFRNFNLESLRSSLETSAPHLSLLLRKVQPKSKQRLQTDSPCKSRAFGETMPLHAVERPSWLSVRHAESDPDATLEDTAADQDLALGWESDPKFSSITEGQYEQNSACKDEPDPEPRKDPRCLSSRLVSSKTPYTTSIDHGIIYVIHIHHSVPQGAVKGLPSFGQESSTQATNLFSIRQLQP
ncbi:hypothetical protein KVV02_003138 [Mortierella alpina]|uniref:Uncharacterized protein n=1 Tax=Mortierella alpina TaxID=64518 RepID=A0A9P7ZWV7_MORAP|nr:hypothetical protein KVV02_003138 [Mortierella alpina]